MFKYLSSLFFTLAFFCSATFAQSPKTVVVTEQTFKVGALKEKFLAFRTDMNRGIDVYVNNPVIGTQEEYNTKIKDDGTFELEIPLVTTFQSVLFRNQFVSDNILLSPGKETSIYVDMQQMSSQKTVNGAIKRPDEQFVFFEGANAEINNQMLLPEVTKCMEGVFTQNKLTNEVAGMTALQYKAYILGELDKGISSLASLGLSQKVQQFAGIRLRGMACYYLLSADYYLENAYRTANKLNWDAPLTGYKAPIINKEYYSLVKEMGVNNALSLYDNMYYNNINSCKYAVHHSKPVTFRRMVIPDLLIIIKSLSSVTDLIVTNLPVLSVIFIVLTPLPPRLVLR
jgi:hypothetical protein